MKSAGGDEASTNLYVRQCLLPTTSLNFTFRCKSQKCPTSNFYILEFEIKPLLLEVKLLLLKVKHLLH